MPTTQPDKGTEYTQGFRAGKNYARAEILEYIGLHSGMEYGLSMETIAEQIIAWDNADIAAFLKEHDEN